GGGFLWLAAAPTTVIRVDPADPSAQPLPALPDDGVQGAIRYHGGEGWVAGSSQVFPLTSPSRIPIAGTGAPVGAVTDLAFGAGSLWVVSGGPGHLGGLAQALRRVDPGTLAPEQTIAVGSNPISVAVAASSVWVASRSDAVVERVDPELNRVV